MLEAQDLKFSATAFIKPCPQQSIVSIAAFAGATGDLRQALGVALPDMPQRLIAGDITYLWSGPESWLAISDDPALLSRLAVAQPFAAVTDQSDGRVILRVTGRQARAILAKLVPIDLHQSAFPQDVTALTLAGHIAVQIWRNEEGDFLLACFRSFVEALDHSLAGAAREFEG